MPILNKKVSLCRYQIEGDMSALVATLAEGLKANAFADSFTAAYHAGPVNIDDLLDISWAVSGPEKGEYLTFALRIDTRSIPAPALKLEIAKREKAELAASGLKKLPRSRRKELKELVFDLLLQTAPAKPKTFDVVIDSLAGVLYSEAMPPVVQSSFEELCAQLNVKAVLETPSIRAARVLSSEEPKEQPSKPKEVDDSVSQDFLTWLWWHVSENGPVIGGGKVDFTGSMTATNEEGKVVSSDKSEEPVFTELKAAVASGKHITKATLLIAKDDLEWTVTLDSWLNINGLQCPSEVSNDDETPDAAFLERIFLIEEFDLLLDSIYKIFLDVRLSSRWAEATNSIEKWANVTVSE